MKHIGKNDLPIIAAVLTVAAFYLFILIASLL